MAQAGATLLHHSNILFLLAFLERHGAEAFPHTSRGTGGSLPGALSTLCLYPGVFPIKSPPATLSLSAGLPPSCWLPHCPRPSSEHWAQVTSVQPLLARVYAIPISLAP